MQEVQNESFSCHSQSSSSDSSLQVDLRLFEDQKEAISKNQIVAEDDVGERPRETLTRRVIRLFKLGSQLEDGAIVEALQGENMDISLFAAKVHIPSTRSFSHVKFFNPRTGRSSNVFSCDIARCGKIFRKWHNLFDHLRIHTGEKPFACPVDGCNLYFNQVSNQKKHLTTHRSFPYLVCAFCKQRVSKK